MSTRPPPPTIPMKWIVVSIGVFIVLYTVVNIYYRKPAPPHRPYEEMVNRTITARLQASGWHRLPVETRRPAEKPTSGGASVNRGGKGLGPGLADCYVEPPAMLATIDHVSAPAEVARGETCTVFFTGSVPNQQLQLGDVILYQHDKESCCCPSPSTSLASACSAAGPTPTTTSVSPQARSHPAATRCASSPPDRRCNGRSR